MICATCFADNADSAAFCTKCGFGFARKGGGLVRAAPPLPMPALASRARDEPAFEFRDPRGLRTWVVILLVCLGGLLLLRIDQDLAQLRLIDALRLRRFASELEALQAANANDAWRQTLITAYVVVFVVTMVVFCLWIYRMATNARAITMHHFEISPRMAVISNFIPFLNLWVPYQAMSEIWRASRNVASWRGDGAGALLAWWWAAWVASSILGNFALRINAGPKTLEDTRWSTQLSLVWDPLDFISVVMSVLLVIRLTRYQVRASTGDALHKVFE